MKLLAWISALAAISHARVALAAKELDTKSSAFVLDTNVAAVFAIPAHAHAHAPAGDESAVAGEADAAKSHDDNAASVKFVLDTNIVVVTPADAPSRSPTPSPTDALRSSPTLTEATKSSPPPSMTLSPYMATASPSSADAVASEADSAIEPSAPDSEISTVSTPETHAADAATSATTGDPSRKTHVQFAIRAGSVKSRGVNLGGWLVAEHWMTKNSELWWGLSSDDADRGEYTAMNRTRRVLADLRAKAHRDHFITERDIAEIARAGLNTVRVPVGYWIVGFDHHDASNKREWRAYAPNALEYLDRLIRVWAAKHDVAVLVSLHAAKGSQNGADHSSPTVSGSSFWGSYPENVASTLDAVQFLARRYQTDDAFLGIGLLNEPGGSTPTDALYRYYEDAYQRIRHDDANDCVLTIAPRLTEQSPEFLTELLPRATNVWVEWHRYFVWGYEDTSESELLEKALPAFRADAERWKTRSDKKLFIGEFSFASARGQFGASVERLRAFARAQLDVLESAVDGGWAFWTWRVDGDDDPSDPFARWSLRNMLANRIVSTLAAAP